MLAAALWTDLSHSTGLLLEKVARARDCLSKSSNCCNSLLMQFLLLCHKEEPHQHSQSPTCMPGTFQPHWNMQGSKAGKIQVGKNLSPFPQQIFSTHYIRRHYEPHYEPQHLILYTRMNWYLYSPRSKPLQLQSPTVVVVVYKKSTNFRAWIWNICTGSTYLLCLISKWVVIRIKWFACLGESARKKGSFSPRHILWYLGLIKHLGSCFQL